jgi:(4-(4-[2-(gamma-L-glutamylamino)ethyl]phenoxymethyl)furan-2-yl)methanamine synthase
MNASVPAVLGLDVGGANLKAAHSTGRAQTRPFALWKHPERLAIELRALRKRMPPHDVLALTMTGELCDGFPSRRDGVLAILRSAVEAAAGTPLLIWTTRAELVEPAVVRADPLSAAAANWLALAHLAARGTERAPALLIDTGSTTTDLVFIDQGMPCPRALSDRERLASGELVYTGIRRTPVCAVLGMGVAAELFATMLDVYLLLGLWPENPADTETADGRPATRIHARARLARMWCADAEEITLPEIEALARRILKTQMEYVSAAINRVLAERATPRRIILSGSGEALGRQALDSILALRAVPIVSLSEQLGPWLSEAACAYAVAVLAAEKCGRPMA